MYVTLLVLAIVLWVWAAIDIFKSGFNRNFIVNTLWFFLIILFPFLGPIIYFQLKNWIVRRYKRYNDFLF